MPDLMPDDLRRGEVEHVQGCVRVEDEYKTTPGGGRRHQGCDRHGVRAADKCIRGRGGHQLQPPAQGDLVGDRSFKRERVALVQLHMASACAQDDVCL